MRKNRKETGMNKRKHTEHKNGEMTEEMKCENWSKQRESKRTGKII